MFNIRNCIPFKWKFNFVDQINNEIHENWYSMNIDETRVELICLLVKLKLD